MTARANLEGKEFGSLTAMHIVGADHHEWGKTMIWECLCLCGTLISRTSAELMFNEREGKRQMCKTCAIGNLIEHNAFKREDRKRYDS